MSPEDTMSPPDPDRQQPGETFTRGMISSIEKVKPGWTAALDNNSSIGDIACGAGLEIRPLVENLPSRVYAIDSDPWSYDIVSKYKSRTKDLKKQVRIIPIKGDAADKETYLHGDARLQFDLLLFRSPGPIRGEKPWRDIFETALEHRKTGGLVFVATSDAKDFVVEILTEKGLEVTIIGNSNFPRALEEKYHIIGHERSS